MKKLFIVTLSIVLFTACQSNQPVRYTQNSPEIDIIKAAIMDYEAGNWESFRSHYADTAQSFHNSKDRSTRPDMTVKMAKQNLEGISSYSFLKDEGDIEMVIDDDGKTWVNYWGIWEGTLASNNTKLTIPVHLTFQMVDKKIVREYGYWDNAPRMKAEMDMSKANDVKSATMTKDATMKKTGTEKKDVSKNKDAVMKKN